MRGRGGRRKKLTLAAGLATGSLPMSCSRCKNSPQLREAWGCDKETVQPIAEIGCPSCGDTRAPDCLRCAGRGSIPVTRCPNVTVPVIYREVVNALVLLDRGLGFPVSGGTSEQSAWFMAAMSHVQPLFDAAKEHAAKR